MKTMLAVIALTLAAVAVAPAAQAEGVSVCEHKYVGQCLVTVYTTGDGEVCFYVSLQVPTCTPPVAPTIAPLPDGAAACTKPTGCVFTVYWTEDNVCFYPTTAPTMCLLG